MFFLQILMYITIPNSTVGTPSCLVYVNNFTLGSLSRRFKLNIKILFYSTLSCNFISPIRIMTPTTFFRRMRGKMKACLGR